MNKNQLLQLVAYLVAILGITAIGVGALAYLENHRPGGEWNSNVTYAVIGIVTPTLTVLIGIIKSIGNGKAIEDAKNEVKSHIDNITKGT
jgi:hypothetical protein